MLFHISQFFGMQDRQIRALICLWLVISCSAPYKESNKFVDAVEPTPSASGYLSPNPIQGNLPEPRSSPGMTYDEERRVVVLVGGSASRKTLNDTWEYDGNQWRLIEMPPPMITYAPAMTYSQSLKKIVLIDWTPSIWEYDGLRWQQVLPQNQLPRIWFPEIGYDPSLERIVVFGEVGAGSSYKTWLYDGVDLEKIDSSHPYYDWGVRGQSYDRIFFPSLVYDRKNREMILQPPFKWTFVLKNNTWEIKLSEEQSTLPDCVYCIWPKMVYDTKRNLIVMFDGENTWELIDGNWTKIETPISPPRRTGHAMAYDQARSVTVLFGGENENEEYLNDLWEYDGTTWVQR